MRNTLIALLVLSLSTGTCLANSETGQSVGSQVMASGAASTLLGSVELLTSNGKEGATLIVSGMSLVAEGVLVTLSEGPITLSLTLSKQVAEMASLAVGQTISVVKQASGYAFIASGQVIAFVADEARQTLIHHSEHH